MIKYKKKVKRAWLHTEDHLRKKGISNLFSIVRYLLSLPRGRSIDSLDAIADLLMHVPNSPVTNTLKTRGHLIAETVGNSLGTFDEMDLGWSVLLKPQINSHEPGVLLVSFESELLKLLRIRRLSSLLENYQICFLPSWQPFYSKEVFLLAAVTKKPFFILPSNLGEQELCESFSPKCRYVPLHAASWVNGELYGMSKATKDIDIVILANFGRHKRHWKLFEALGALPEHLKICLYGVPRGNRTSQALEKEASYFDVASRFTIIEAASNEVIRDALSRSRLFCALTHREGSYIGVAEALMAGVPVAMFYDAYIGTKAYINKDTGFLLDPDKPLAPQLLSALELVNSMDTRSWSEANISSQRSNIVLNKYLEASALIEGFNWSKEVEPVFSQRFEFYYHKGIEMEKNMFLHYEKIKNDFGLNISRPKYN